MIRQLSLTGLATAILLLLPPNALAVSIQGVANNVPYVIGFKPLNSSQQPYLGQLHLNFNNGIVSGTYTDLSTRPGSPFANAHKIPVSGGTSGGQITLHIRMITFRGSISGQKMSGSATIRGGIYTFEAHQGSPGSGKQ